jgi:hypothetical protein
MTTTRDLMPAGMAERPHDDNTRDLLPARMAELSHADNARDLPSARMAEVSHDDNAKDFPLSRMVGLSCDDNERDLPSLELHTVQIQHIRNIRRGSWRQVQWLARLFLSDNVGPAILRVQ